VVDEIDCRGMTDGPGNKAELMAETAYVECAAHAQTGLSELLLEF
jgi:hypothetical protein